MKFKQDTQVSAINSSGEEQKASFTASVSESWGINKVPNGGYLMAMLANAVAETANKDALMSVTANFLSRTKPGDVTIQTSVMAESKQLERFQASMFQNETETIRAFAVLSDHYREALSYQAYSAPKIDPRNKCIRLLGNSSYSLFKNINILLEYDSTAYLRGKQLDHAQHRGWIGLPQNEPWSAASILFACDAVSPPVLSLKGMSPWVPTIEMSVQIRRLPQTSWLKFVFKTRFVSEDIIEEDGELWDENGNLIAISRQLAMYRPAEISKSQLAFVKAYIYAMRAKTLFSKSEAS